MFIRFLLVLLVAAPAVAADPAYEVVPCFLGYIAVPKGWRYIDAYENGSAHQLGYVARKGMTLDLYLQGDGGIGVPPTDETGARLQIGMAAYTYVVPDETPMEAANIYLRLGKENSRLKLVRKSIVPIKLDGMDALLLTAEYIKDRDRRSLQIKVIADDKRNNDLRIMSGHIIGGKASKWPTAGSSLAKWLTAHLTSFTFDETKIDRKKLDKAYAER